ncbi:MAG: carbohydrate binding family 9 domain-containing protein [Acidobacteria bacterium]|nr:carbohydrate binding family 9 domain-containing protein [Acidobacteriota bacterium]
MRLFFVVGGMALAIFSSQRALATSDLSLRGEYRAVRTDETPRIDGELSERIWETAPAITDFVQQEPETGNAPTERTVVRFIYDDSALYVGASLRDSHPVTSKLARRDSYLASDWLAVYLDTHYDRRTARMFRVNPLGVQRDSLVVEEDEEDRSWDAVWTAATRVVDGGWTVEMRIPFAQLRFPERESHVWGFNVEREISRNNEVIRLVHVPRNETGFVKRFARLVGIESVNPPRRLEVLPYVVGRVGLRSADDPSNPFDGGTEEMELGLDLEYGLSSNLTLTAALNPDFGQVEVDPAEVNLTAFELFYPERRPFFLEGADLLSFGGPSLFYSRRIGRSPQGRPAAFDFAELPGQTTILGAAKITGRTESGWSIAALDAITEEEEAPFLLEGERDSAVVEPLTNYFVTRVSKDLSGAGQVSAMLTSVHRSGTTIQPELHDEAYSAGADGYQYFGEREYLLDWSAYGSYVAGSAESILRTQRSSARYFQRPDATHLEIDPGRTSLTGWGGSMRFRKVSGNLRYTLTGLAASPELEINDAGFLGRVDEWASLNSIAWVDPVPRGRLRSRSYILWKIDRFNFGGDHLLDRSMGIVRFTYSNYWQTSWRVIHDAKAFDDRSTRGGPLIRTPSNTFYQASVSTDFRKRWYGTLRGNIEHGGMDLEARRLNVEVSYRPSPAMTMSVGPSWSQVRFPYQHVRTVADSTAGHTFGSRYVFAPIERKTLELATRFDWAISRTLTLELFLQPFVSSGDYLEFRELERPSSRDYDSYSEIGDVSFDEEANRYTIDPDGSGPAQPFSFQNPDFNVRSLRGNVVVRWEFRPGSAAYLVWTQNRAERALVGDFDAGRDFDALLGLDADDVILVKVSYWLGL